jgi:hypothetical protein
VAALAVLLASTALGSTPAGADGPVAGATERISDTGGGVPNSDVETVDISGNGRFVVFNSSASDLVGAGPSTLQVYVWDRLTDTNEIVSISSSEVPAALGASGGSISDDGRYVAFTSNDPNLAFSDTNAQFDVFVRDRVSGSTELVSKDAAGNEGDGQSNAGVISGDGRYVAFQSTADNLVPSDNGQQSIYRKDRTTGAIVKASLSTLEVQNETAALGPEISDNGQYVTFQSESDNLTLNDTNEARDVFRRDVTNGTTALVSRPDAGLANDDSAGSAMSDSGRYVAFYSSADNLVPGESGDAFADVFVRDMTGGTIERVSVTSSEVKGNADSLGVSISGDGDRVAFHTFASNLGAPAGEATAVIRDRSASTTTVVSGSPEAGLPAGGAYPFVSDDGRYAAFHNAFIDGVTPGRGYVRILADATFPDVPSSHLFFEEISWMIDEGIATGYADGTYRPTATLTRQATAAFLFRLAGEPPFDPPDVPTFSDIPTTHTFFEQIEWAASVGLVNGYPDGTFRPAGVISRQALAAFLYRAAGEPAFGEPSTPTFPDVPTTHTFFTEIEWLAATDIGGGLSDGTFRPGATVTRQSMAAFLFRFTWVVGGIDV